MDLRRKVLDKDWEKLVKEFRNDAAIAWQCMSPTAVVLFYLRHFIYFRRVTMCFQNIVALGLFITRFDNPIFQQESELLNVKMTFF